jgi:hypothetical protein
MLKTKPTFLLAVGSCSVSAQVGEKFKRDERAHWERELGIRQGQVRVFSPYGQKTSTQRLLIVQYVLKPKNLKHLD